MLNEELKEQKKSIEAFLKQQKEQHELMENQNEKLRKVLKDNENFITAKFYPYIMASKMGQHNIFYHSFDEIMREGMPIQIIDNLSCVKKVGVLGEIIGGVEYVAKNYDELFVVKYAFDENVKDMSERFCCCGGVLECDLSNFNCENVINMEGMFRKCKNFEVLNLSYIYTHNVTNMSKMFFDCGGAKIRDDLPYNINDSEEFCFCEGTEIIFRF